MTNKSLTPKEIEEAAILSAKKWFYETFEDDLLQKLQGHGLIAQEEGFSISCILELESYIKEIESYIKDDIKNNQVNKEPKP